MLVLRAASATACTAVNGGPTTISTSVTSLIALRSSFTNRTASCTVLYIFQLPAMNGIRIGPGGPSRPGGSGGSEPSGNAYPAHPTYPAYGAQVFSDSAAT